MSPFQQGILVLLFLFLEDSEAKKQCWYFEGVFPTHYICRSYEDCCGSRCCVRSLSIQRLWYFWFLLMMGVLFCCGAGFFIRRRMYPPPLVDETTYNVSFTRPPNSSTPGWIWIPEAFSRPQGGHRSIPRSQIQVATARKRPPEPRSGRGGGKRRSIPWPQIQAAAGTMAERRQIFSRSPAARNGLLCRFRRDYDESYGHELPCPT